jgi:hypothetical protein
MKSWLSTIVDEVNQYNYVYKANIIIEFYPSEEGSLAVSIYEKSQGREMGLTCKYPLFLGDIDDNFYKDIYRTLIGSNILKSNASAKV